MDIQWNEPYCQDDWTCEECGLFEWDCICGLHEGDWCEHCQKIQPLKDNRLCALCGTKLGDDGNEWHEAVFNSTADAFLGVDDYDEDEQ